jgi:hypothetical protein
MASAALYRRFPRKKNAVLNVSKASHEKKRRSKREQGFPQKKKRHSKREQGFPRKKNVTLNVSRASHEKKTSF